MNFDNAYNSSRDPIPGFNMSRVQGVENFKRNEHFLYLKQEFEPDHASNDPNSNPKSPNFNPKSSKTPNFTSGSEKFSKVRQYIQENKDLKSIARGNKATKLAFLGVSVVFCIACSIGLYW
uniref:Uncharacterized protein n=1 Tax=Theileria annulata TaxID=5874 RepID=A0A3B0MVR7_THEAN